MTEEMKPCLFCGGSMSVRTNRDWHRLVGEHPEDCLLQGLDPYYAATPENRAALVSAWNTRATPSHKGEVGGWQPIETAPKGYKVHAGYRNRLDKWRTVTACYYLPQTLLLQEDRDDLDDDGYAPEGWYEESETQDAILPIEHPPTHWMPLPAAPAKEAVRHEQDAKPDPSSLQSIPAVAVGEQGTVGGGQP